PMHRAMSTLKETHMKTAGMFLAAWVVLAAAATAQVPPKPGPELKKLDIFVGSWTLDGNMKPGTMGPGGSMTESEKCEWMEGGFYIVCHSDYKSSMGNGVGLSVMGYSADDKAYTYREFNSFGEFDDSKGTLDGDTWTWTNDEKMGGMTMKGRFTIKMTSATSYNFTFDMSQDGTKWSTVMDGKASKK
ncbi:MAG: DUF1579 family protein, partial [Candidatus Sulfotelmatobacter sp.]